MSYSALRSIGDAASDAGQAAAQDAALRQAQANLAAAHCPDFASWKQTQLACNASPSVDSLVCQQARIRPCPMASFDCPSGQVRVVETIPARANAGDHKGEWGSVTEAYCASTYAPAAVTGAVSNHWGLYLGLGIAAFVVYKVATG